MEAWVLAVCPGSWTSDLLHGHARMNMHARCESFGALTNRASQTDIHLIKSLLPDQPKSCHGINLMSLASIGLHQRYAWFPWKLSSTAHSFSCFCSPIAWLASTWHQLDAIWAMIWQWYDDVRSPWKFSSTARFFFLFLFSTTLFGTNLMRLPWHQLWFLLAILFCEVSQPTISHGHFSNCTKPYTTIK